MKVWNKDPHYLVPITTYDQYCRLNYNVVGQYLEAYCLRLQPNMSPRTTLANHIGIDIEEINKNLESRRRRAESMVAIRQHV